MKKRNKFLKKLSKNWCLLLITLILACALSYLSVTSRTEDKSIVVVIPSYNNIQWYERNLSMLIKQDECYKSWRAFYISDASTDGTTEAVEKFIKDNNYEHKITLVKNKERIGQLANLYKVVHKCNNNEIIVVYDGDDFFYDETTLSHINKIYQDKNVWMTYGQYEIYPSGKLGQCRQIPDIVTEQNAFRNYTWCSSHLRTFYAGLFKKIKTEDLKYEGKFLTAATDMATMFPMLEMAGKHAKFIPKVVYVYNQANPINIYKKRLDQTLFLGKLIRGRERYDRVDAIMA